MKSNPKPIRRKTAKTAPTSEAPQTRTETPGPAEANHHPAGTSTARAASASAAQSPPALRAIFAFHAPDAQRVCLCGEFNEWSPEAAPMSRQGDGKWETALLLPPGRYQYKFFADGQWLTDPNAPESVPNIHGSLNSVLEVRA
jgi:1,4-alpha-glucan branching enzyme